MEKSQVAKASASERAQVVKAQRAALLGALCIILPDGSGNGTTAAYLIAVAIAVVYTAVNVIVFWFTADKKYRKIEV